MWRVDPERRLTPPIAWGTPLPGKPQTYPTLGNPQMGTPWYQRGIGTPMPVPGYHSSPVQSHS